MSYGGRENLTYFRDLTKNIEYLNQQGWLDERETKDAFAWAAEAFLAAHLWYMLRPTVYDGFDKILEQLTSPESERTSFLAHWRLAEYANKYKVPSRIR